MKKNAATRKTYHPLLPRSVEGIGKLQKEFNTYQEAVFGVGEIDLGE